MFYIVLFVPAQLHFSFSVFLFPFEIQVCRVESGLEAPARRHSFLCVLFEPNLLSLVLRST